MFAIKPDSCEVAENFNRAVSKESLTIVEPTNKDKLGNAASIAQPTWLSFEPRGNQCEEKEKTNPQQSGISPE